MNTLFGIHPWKLVETELHRRDMRLSETLTSIGNAHIGVRGNFEEAYSGDCHRGTYLAGVWVPVKAHRRRPEIGCPDYHRMAIGAPNLLEIGVTVGGEPIDLSRCQVTAFYRELDMEHGLLLRRYTVVLEQGAVTAEVERFVSIARRELLAIRYRVTPSFDAAVAFTPALDAAISSDSDGGDALWAPEDHGGEADSANAAYVLVRTRDNPFGAPRFAAYAAMSVSDAALFEAEEGRVSYTCVRHTRAGEAAEIVKLVCADTSRGHEGDAALAAHVLDALRDARNAGYDALRTEQCAAWRARWGGVDVRIDGDDSAQQGVRFGIFQTLCAYDGTDPEVGIGNGGLAGRAAGWEAEMFCLPMILSTLGEEAAKNLLQYRYLHLETAKERAARLGCAGALYPASTEDALEEIHQNAAVFYAIFLTHEYSGDAKHMREYGLPVMLEICRYWISRAAWHEKKRCYMFLGVNGPNGYESNVSNNWYTNRMAKFCLEETARYTRTVVGMRRAKTLGADEREIARFERIASKIYLPEDKRLGIFVQQDGYLDKEIIPAAALNPAERPLHGHWSRDRILRSCYIMQADVLQGLYCLRHLYDRETVARNFAFYEPLTVHEGSLSPCVHAILAADVGEYDRAAELFRRAARLDLNNLCGDTENGLHIPAMCGGWMAAVKGFAGVRTEQGVLEFAPRVPWAFRSFGFRLRIQGRLIDAEIGGGRLTISLCSGPAIMIQVYGDWHALRPGKRVKVPIRETQGNPA